jgi:hypothetical protein
MVILKRLWEGVLKKSLNIGPTIGFSTMKISYWPQKWISEMENPASSPNLASNDLGLFP